ncbi:MAG: hypothetical protein Q9222_001949 [Ikaeria aurantiellina]
MQREEIQETPETTPDRWVEESIPPQHNDVYDQATLLNRRKKSSRDRFHTSWGIYPEHLLPQLLESRDKEFGRTTLETLATVAENFPLQQAESILKEIVLERVGREAHVGQSRRPRLTRADVTEAMSRLGEKTRHLPKRNKRKQDFAPPDAREKRQPNVQTPPTEYPTPEQARSARLSLPDDDPLANYFTSGDNASAQDDQHPPSSPPRPSIHRLPAETPPNVPLVNIPVRSPFGISRQFAFNDRSQPQSDSHPSLLSKAPSTEHHVEALKQSVHTAYTEFTGKLDHAQHSYKQVIVQSINDINRIRTCIEATEEDAMRSRTAMEEAISALEEAAKAEEFARRKAQGNSSVIRIYEREPLSEEMKASMAGAYQLARSYESQVDVASEATAAAYNNKESCQESLHDIEERLQDLEKEQRRACQVKDQCTMAVDALTRFVGQVSSAASEADFAPARAFTPQ